MKVKVFQFYYQGKDCLEISCIKTGKCYFVNNKIKIINKKGYEIFADFNKGELSDITYKKKKNMTKEEVKSAIELMNKEGFFE